MQNDLAPLRAEGSCCPSELEYAIFECMVVVAAAMLLLIATFPKSFGANDRSRLATVESLVHRQTFAIHESPFRTIDMVYVEGRVLSSKPPVLPVLMAAEYWVLYRVFGCDIRGETGARLVIKVLTLTFVGLPFIVYLLLLRTVLNWYIQSGAVRILALLGGAFCNHAMGMAVTINNHVPAGAALFAAAFLCLGLAHRKLPSNPFMFVAAGLLIMTASVLEFWCLLFLPFFVAYLLRHNGLRNVGWYVLGMAPMALFHLGLTYVSLGTVLPAYVHPDWYYYPGSYWLEPEGVDALREPKLQYLFNMTFGFRGAFLFYPILLIPVATTVMAWRRKELPLRPEVLGIGVAVLVSIVVNWLATTNYGGCAQGFRGFIFFTPLFLGMGALGLAEVRRPWQWIVVAVLLGVSLASMIECANRPWSCKPYWVSALFNAGQ